MSHEMAAAAAAVVRILHMVASVDLSSTARESTALDKFWPVVLGVAELQRSEAQPLNELRTLVQGWTGTFTDQQVRPRQLRFVAEASGLLEKFNYHDIIVHSIIGYILHQQQ